MCYNAVSIKAVRCACEWPETQHVTLFTDVDLQVNENEYLPRPEESRITQAEKNKRMQQQLKVRYTWLFYLCHCRQPCLMCGSGNVI